MIAHGCDSSIVQYGRLLYLCFVFYCVDSVRLALALVAATGLEAAAESLQKERSSIISFTSSMTSVLRALAIISRSRELLAFKMSRERRRKDEGDDVGSVGLVVLCNSCLQPTDQHN